MAVVFHHCYLSYPETTRATLNASVFSPWSFLMTGRFAVMLFFVLSGFVLSLPTFSGTASPYLPYLARRVCRLYLPFAAAICVAGLLCKFFGGFPLPALSDHFNLAWSQPATKNVVLSHLLMLPDSTRLDDPIWSLIVEFRISLIFPLLILCGARFGWKSLPVGILVAFLCAKIQAAVPPEIAYNDASETLFDVGRYGVFFLMGILLAGGLERVRSGLTGMPRPFHLAVCLSMIAVHMRLVHMNLTDHGYADILYGFFAMYVIACCVTFPKLANVLSAPVLLWLGEISYSLYLIHWPVILAAFYLLHAFLPHAAILAVALPLSLLAGWAMHYMVERPSRQLGARLARRLEKPEAVSSVS